MYDAQVRIIEKRFRKKYKARYADYKKIIDEPNTIAMNWYYRNRFGITEKELQRRIKNNEKFDLLIMKADCRFQKIWAFLIHPNDVVKIATWLALISIFTSLILGGLSLYFSFFK